MAVIYHDSEARWFGPPAAAVAIDAQERLTVQPGYWPDAGGAFVAVAAAEAQLEADDRAVLLAREGTQGQPGVALVLSDRVLPYGLRPVSGGYEVQPYVDLLAWREGADWHVKRLVQGVQR